MSETCNSRGPRIGSEGTPICHLPKFHEGAHRPAPEDGWGDHMRWTDHSFAGVANADNARRSGAVR